MDLSVGGLGKGHDCRVGLKESPRWREEAQICVKQLLSGRDCRSDSERETMNWREAGGGESWALQTYILNPHGLTFSFIQCPALPRLMESWL